MPQYVVLALIYWKELEKRSSTDLCEGYCKQCMEAERTLNCVLIPPLHTLFLWYWQRGWHAGGEIRRARGAGAAGVDWRRGAAGRVRGVYAMP